MTFLILQHWLNLCCIPASAVHTLALVFSPFFIYNLNFMELGAGNKVVGRAVLSNLNLSRVARNR